MDLTAVISAVSVDNCFADIHAAKGCTVPGVCCTRVLVQEVLVQKQPPLCRCSSVVCIVTIAVLCMTSCTIIASTLRIMVASMTIPIVTVVSVAGCTIVVGGTIVYPTVNSCSISITISADQLSR